MRGLGDKVMVVAGAGNGIGAASAARLAEEGAKVVVADIDLRAAEVVAGQIDADGGHAIALAYDQSDENSIARMVADAASHFGRLDGLHANAAGTGNAFIDHDLDVTKMDVSLWERTLKVNVIGYGVLLREVIPHLLSDRGGAVVLTSSVAAHHNSDQGKPAYSSSKAAVNAICRHVAAVWGSKGVRCNAIAPGVVLTEALRKVIPQVQVDDFLRSTRSNRLGTPQDIAAAAAFLLSDDAAWVNGQVWNVNGGLTFRD